MELLERGALRASHKRQAARIDRPVRPVIQHAEHEPVARIVRPAPSLRTDVGRSQELDELEVAHRTAGAITAQDLKREVLLSPPQPVKRPELQRVIVGLPTAATVMQQPARNAC